MINYLLITKPGIIAGNLLTVAMGFMLASKGFLMPSLFLASLLGMTFIMASACIFNNYIDIQIDKKMKRTQNRPMVLGLVSIPKALFLGVILFALGNIILFLFTNGLSTAVADIGFFVYVVLYSLWKGRTVYGTAIGSIAGAVPPLVGYCAVSNRLDLGAGILFAMLVLWQMPHFFSIAIYRFEEYAAAGIPVLPQIKGMLRAKVHMTLYIFAFMVAAGLLTLFQFTGKLYLCMVLGLGVAWFVLCLKGFHCLDEKRWGKQMFRLSLVLITALSLTVPFDTLP